MQGGSPVGDGVGQTLGQFTGVGELRICTPGYKLRPPFTGASAPSGGGGFA